MAVHLYSLLTQTGRVNLKLTTVKCTYLHLFNNETSSFVRWLMPGIQAFGRMGQENHKFQAYSAYILCFSSPWLQHETLCSPASKRTQVVSKSKRREMIKAAQETLRIKSSSKEIYILQSINESSKQHFQEQPGRWFE